jgi:uncharacterized protein
MSFKRDLSVFDCLYGEITFEQEMFDLINSPLVQRLRQVRLSNIDSLSMPGIANISRYEHSLGAAHLVTHVGFYRQLVREQRLAFQAAALIHDSAITPFGHLAEEGLRYVDAHFDHQSKWSLLLAGEDSTIGGLGLQLYYGLGSGLREWALKTFGSEHEEMLETIVAAIQGKGRFGRCIAGDIDLDNLDNVTRIAFHMGLRPNLRLPSSVAIRMLNLDEQGQILYSEDAGDLINEWLGIREAVYSRLMLSELDFCGKVMLLFATVRAFENGLMNSQDWVLTDSQFLDRLISCDNKEIREAVLRWLTGKPWDLSQLLWMEGDAPAFTEMHRFSGVLTEELHRPCFAYGIKDKRQRELRVRFRSGRIATFGKRGQKWLLGAGSPRPISNDDSTRVASLAREFFGMSSTPVATSRSASASLFETA